MKQWVESGKFEEQMDTFLRKSERVIQIVLAFVAGYFAFAVVRMFQG
jgi:hypothetical protein